MSLNNKMTALADEIRTLSGTTNPMSIDTMTSTLNTENTNFNTNLNIQEDLIAQIQAAVDNLPETGDTEIALQNKTVTPSTNTQTVTADRGYDGLNTVTIEGDANLIANNIKSGVSIFGITGTAESGGGSSSENVETCTVTFDNENLSNDCPILVVFATVFENGVYTNYVYQHHYSNSASIFSITIPNVVCGTKICLISSIYQVKEAGVYVEIDGSAVYNSHTVISRYDHALLEFTAPSVTNENCTIYYAFNA